FAGVYGDQGSEDQPAVYVRLAIAAYGAALLAASGAVAALEARDRTGRGQKVETPLLNGALAMQAASLVSGERVRPVMRVRPNQYIGLPAYRLFQASDGWFFVACGNSTFWNKFLIALGQEELLDDPRF